MPANDDGIRHIKLDPKTTRFHKGVAAGNKVREGHGDLDAPFEVKLGLYWFYVGALAGEMGLKTQEELYDFMQGASVRQPERPEPEDKK